MSLIAGARWALIAVGMSLGGLAALAGLYLFLLAAAALGYRPRRPLPGRGRLSVLVPAHNEADLIQRCVKSLRQQRYPASCFEIVVIADNCTDDTARLASEAGARTLVRDDPAARGKGQALRWAMDLLLFDGSAGDAFVIVDADSVADEGLLAGLASSFESGAEAVQAEYLVLDEGSPGRVPLRSVAFLLFHRVRFAGRAVLGLPCHLVGNGMLLSRSLIQRHPWEAFTSAEDLEYSVSLRLAGVRPAFAGSAQVRAPMAKSDRATQLQRERWEGGRLHVALATFPKLAREILVRRRFSLIDVAVDLAVPPLALLAMGSTGGAAVAAALWGADLMPAWSILPWGVAIVVVAGFVGVGLRAARAPSEMYRSLLGAPHFLVRKALGTAGVLRNRGADTWIRTERPSEVG